MNVETIKTEFASLCAGLGIRKLPEQYDLPLELDSLEQVQLCLTVEKQFKITITIDQLELLSTYNNWLNIIENKFA